MKEQWNWGSRRTNWFKRADSYTGFYSALAQELIPEFEDSRTVCDIGCGLGLISLTLSKYFDKIYCVDNNRDAMSSLEEDIASLDIKNIELIVKDCSELSVQWDAILLCFFAGVNAEELLPYCRRLITVVNIGKTYLSAEDGLNRHYTRARLDNALQGRGIEYRVRELSLEFGQPLCSMPEAYSFLQMQTPDATQEEIAAFLDERMAVTGRSRYPLYIPHRKDLAVYTIKGQLE